MNIWIVFSLILFIIAFVFFYIEHLEDKTTDYYMSYTEAVIDDFKTVLIFILFTVIIFLALN
jgi:nucleoside recognition membrane protein YjiH